MIKPWIFEFFHSLDHVEARDPQKVHDHFENHLKMWTRDEELGFEGIFFSEHHFGPGFSPSPNLIIAAMANRTTTLRLGTIGLVAGYTPSWRIVEENAMLDHLTNGRLEIGLVRGIAHEMAEVGITKEEADAHFDAALQVLDIAHADGPVLDHDDGYWKVKARMVPGYLQQPSPPKWTAVVHEPSAERAGRRGWKICLGFSSAEELRDVVKAYLAAAEKAGRTAGPDDVGVRRRVLFVDDPSQIAAARDRGREEQTKLVTTSRALDPDSIPDAPRRQGNERGDDEFIAGTPAAIAEAIIRQCRIIGAGNFVANFYEIPGENGICESHERFGREVIPLLRKADIGAATASVTASTAPRAPW